MGKNWNNGLKSEPVTTYVADETKEAWKEHADDMNVTLSRYVELMVNAGRTSYTESVSEKTRGDEEAVRDKKVIEKVADETDASENVVRGIYYSLENQVYRDIDEISVQNEVNPETTYGVLQELMDFGVVDYDAVKDGYRKKRRVKT